MRYEVFKRLGYFVTESSEHFAEYVPWFIKRDRPDLVKAFNIPLDEYIRRCEVQIASWERMRKAWRTPRPRFPSGAATNMALVLSIVWKPVHPVSSTETSQIMV